MGSDVETGTAGENSPDNSAASDPARAGRKPGAKGKFTLGLSEQIRADYGRSPAEELARRAFMDPKDFAREAGLYKGKGEVKTLDVGRAYDKQTKVLVALLPYTEKKMPTQIEITDEKRVVLQIGRVSADQGEMPAGGRTIDLVPANISKGQQNQRLNHMPIEKSDSAKSDSEG